MILASIQHIITGNGSLAHAVKNAFIGLGFGLVGPGKYRVDDWLAKRRVRRSQETG